MDYHDCGLLYPIRAPCKSKNEYTLSYETQNDQLIEDIHQYHSRYPETGYTKTRAIVKPNLACMLISQWIPSPSKSSLAKRSTPLGPVLRYPSREL